MHALGKARPSSPPPHASVCSPRRGHAMVISDFESSSAAWNSHRIEPKVTIKFRQNLHTTLKRNMPVYSRFNKYNNKNVKYIWHGGDDTLEFGHELGLSSWKALKFLLQRDVMCKRGLCCRPVSVRLSVRPSVCLCIVSRLGLGLGLYQIGVQHYSAEYE